MTSIFFQTPNELFEKHVDNWLGQRSKDYTVTFKWHMIYNAYGELVTTDDELKNAFLIEFVDFLLDGRPRDFYPGG